MTAKIYHAELWGKREDKYNWLIENDLTSTPWQELSPKPEFYLFIPRDESCAKKYEQFFKITDIFPVNSVGIVTSRDEFVIDFDAARLRRRLLQFRDKKLPDEIIQLTYHLKDKLNWSLKAAREAILNDNDWEKAFTKILYRPFDERHIYYHDALIERSRKEVMQHMLNDNLALITARSNKSGEMNHFFCSHLIMETKCGESTTQSYLFPLYIYLARNKPNKRYFGSAMMLFEPSAEYGIKKPNLSAEIVEKLSTSFKKTPSPEEIFYYIYAVLYSATYRTKYAEFLKIDFPRVPFTASYKIFKKMSEHGNRLADLHLLKSVDLDKPIARFQGMGDNRVAKPTYDDKTGRVSINTNQYFEGISPHVWSYQIGGYQVCDKWLKDRKKRILTLEEIQTYCRIVTAINKTIEIQKVIDSFYTEVEDTQNS